MADLVPADYYRPRSTRVRPDIPAIFRTAKAVEVNTPLQVLGYAYDEDGNRIDSSALRLGPEAAWTRQGWFRKCADIRGKAVQSLPWGLYPDGAEPGDYEAAVLTSEDVAPTDDLLALQDLDAAFYLTEVSLSLVGRAYHILQRPPRRNLTGTLGGMTGLQWVNPLLLREKYGASGVDHYIRTVNGIESRVDREAVLAIYQPDPFREIGPGSSDGFAASINATALDEMSTFITSFVKGGLIKKTVLGMADDVRPTPEQKAELESWWRRFNKGGAKAQEAKVLSHAVKPHVIGDGLGDLTDEKLTAEQREAVSAAFGIPFSVMMSNSANYATAEVEERAMLMRTVVPQARIIERTFNRQLFGLYGLALRFEPERTEIMQRFELEKAEKVRSVVGGPVLTVDEGRRLLGYEPMEPEDAPEPPPDIDPSDAPAGGDGQMVEAELSGKALDISALVAEIVGEGY